MGKEIEIKDEERVEHLAEEIKATLSEAVFSARMTLLEAKHKVGEIIAKNPLYRKGSKGSGKLIEEIARRIGRSERDIYLCVLLYQKYPKIERIVQTLKGKKNDITWAAARRLLEGEKKLAEHVCEWETIERCKICHKVKK